MTDVDKLILPAGSIVLLRQAHDPAQRFVDRVWRALSSVFAALPVVNGLSAAANRADWDDVACLINLDGALRAIRYGPVDGVNQIGLTPLSEILNESATPAYAIRRLQTTVPDDKLTERVIDAVRKLESGGSTAWQSDSAALLCDIYFGAFGISLDCSDRTKTVAELFATGGLIDQVLYTSCNRTYLLAPEQ